MKECSQRCAGRMAGWGHPWGTCSLEPRHRVRCQSGSIPGPSNLGVPSAEPGWGPRERAGARTGPLPQPAGPVSSSLFRFNLKGGARRPVTTWGALSSLLQGLQPRLVLAQRKQESASPLGFKPELTVFLQDSHFWRTCEQCDFRSVFTQSAPFLLVTKPNLLSAVELQLKMSCERDRTVLVFL